MSYDEMMNGSFKEGSDDICKLFKEYLCLYTVNHKTKDDFYQNLACKIEQQPKQVVELQHFLSKIANISIMHLTITKTIVIGYCLKNTADRIQYFL